MPTKPDKADRLWIGCSGFSYQDWKGGVFYPEGLPQKKWLEFYAEKFRTVELNVTFYRLPKESAFSGWKDRTPDDFRFVIKGSRYITHRLKLAEVEEPLIRLMDRAKLLDNKLGPLLWQLPPTFEKDMDKLASFAELLVKHAPGQNVFEFRNLTWFDDEVFDCLSDLGMTVCQADWPRELPESPEEFNFMYLRRHGTGPEIFHGSYSDQELERDARRVRRWIEAGKEVYVYFNNDYEGHAPRNALTLRQMVKKIK